MHLWLLIKDAWHTQNLKDKFRIWFMPTGWRPADVAEKYPLYKISDVYQFNKYDTKGSTAFHAWAWVQITITLLSISYLFGNIAAINQLNPYYIYIYGAFVFLTVYAYTELMDRNPYALLWEVAKNCFGVYILISQKDWFGASNYFAGIQYVWMAYFIISTLVTAYFVFADIKKDKTVAVSV